MQICLPGQDETQGDALDFRVTGQGSSGVRCSVPDRSETPGRGDGDERHDSVTRLLNGGFSVLPAPHRILYRSWRACLRIWLIQGYACSLYLLAYLCSYTVFQKVCRKAPCLANLNRLSRARSWQFMCALVTGRDAEAAGLVSVVTTPNDERHLEGPVAPQRWSVKQWLLFWFSLSTSMQLHSQSREEHLLFGFSYILQLCTTTALIKRVPSISIWTLFTNVFPVEAQESLHWLFLQKH